MDDNLAVCILIFFVMTIALLTAHVAYRLLEKSEDKDKRDL